MQVLLLLLLVAVALWLAFGRRGGCAAAGTPACQCGAAGAPAGPMPRSSEDLLTRM